MITHYEMSTGEVLTTDGEVTQLEWNHVSAEQPRLQTIDEAKISEARTAPTIPADLLGVPAAQILARFS